MKDWCIAEMAVFEHLQSMGFVVERGVHGMFGFDFEVSSKNGYPLFSVEVKSTHNSKFSIHRLYDDCDENGNPSYMAFVLFHPLRVVYKRISELEFKENIVKRCIENDLSKLRMREIEISCKYHGSTFPVGEHPHVCSSKCDMNMDQYVIRVSSLKGFTRIAMPKHSHFWECSCGSQFQFSSAWKHLTIGHQIIKVADCNCWWNSFVVSNRCKFQPKKQTINPKIYFPLLNKA